MIDFENEPFEVASEAIEACLNQIVLSALIFDSQHQNGTFTRHDKHQVLFENGDGGEQRIYAIEEESIQLATSKVGEGIFQTTSFRDLHTVTQSVFGFELGRFGQVTVAEEGQLNFHFALTKSTSKNHPALLAKLFETHRVFASFSSDFELEAEHANIVGATLAFDGVFVSPIAHSLQNQRNTAKWLTELCQLFDTVDTLCTVTNDYGPYIEYFATQAAASAL